MLVTYFNKINYVNFDADNRVVISVRHRTLSPTRNPLCPTRTSVLPDIMSGMVFVSKSDI